jgi:hypothetical protein
MRNSPKYDYNADLPVIPEIPETIETSYNPLILVYMPERE